MSLSFLKYLKNLLLEQFTVQDYCSKYQDICNTG